MSFPICCPKCKRTAYEQTTGIVTYYDPRFHCRYCDWIGPLFIRNTNPHPEPTDLFEYFLQTTCAKH